MRAGVCSISALQFYFSAVSFWWLGPRLNFEFEFFWFFRRREAGGEGFCCRGVCRFSLWARPCERVPPFDGEVAGLSDGGLDGARKS